MGSQLPMFETAAPPPPLMMQGAAGARDGGEVPQAPEGEGAGSSPVENTAGSWTPAPQP